MKESEFQKWILDAFDGDRNVKMFRRNVGAIRPERRDGKKGFIRFAEAGQSDLYGWIIEHHCPFCNRVQHGTHFEIEVKSEKGKLTEAQEKWIDFVLETNGIAFVIYPEKNDPIGLRDRILKKMFEMKCPQCVSKSKLNP
jgi:hypothetical protein